MRQSPVNNPIQGFAPTKIVTAGAATPYDVSKVLAIRLDVPSEYYINADSANTANMLPGVTVISKTVQTLTFTAATVLEVMENQGG